MTYRFKLLLVILLATLAAPAALATPPAKRNIIRIGKYKTAHECYGLSLLKCRDQVRAIQLPTF